MTSDPIAIGDRPIPEISVRVKVSGIVKYYLNYCNVYAMPGLTQSVRKACTNVGPLNSARVFQGLRNESISIGSAMYCLGHSRVRSSALVSIRSMNIKYAIIISVGITWAKTKLCPAYVMSGSVSVRCIVWVILGSVRIAWVILGSVSIVWVILWWVSNALFSIVSVTIVGHFGVGKYCLGHCWVSLECLGHSRVSKYCLSHCWVSNLSFGSCLGQ